MKVIPIEIDWHPGLSIYASESFMKTVGDEYGWLGGMDNSGSASLYFAIYGHSKGNFPDGSLPQFQNRFPMK